jgi:hypothetical protein
LYEKSLGKPDADIKGGWLALKKKRVKEVIARVKQIEQIESRMVDALKKMTKYEQELAAAKSKHEAEGSKQAAM